MIPGMKENSGRLHFVDCLLLLADDSRPTSLITSGDYVWYIQLERWRSQLLIFDVCFVMGVARVCSLVFPSSIALLGSANKVSFC